MKMSFLLLFFALGGVAEAAPARVARSLFTPRQERKVLEAVQEACNNTWCEGDYTYEFKKFHCEKSACQLDFDISYFTSYDASGVPDPASLQKLAAHCNYEKVRTLNDVLNRKRDYVSAKYFQSLAKCMDFYSATLTGNIPEPEPTPTMPLPVEVMETDPKAQPTIFNTIFPNGKSPSANDPVNPNSRSSQDPSAQP